MQGVRIDGTSDIRELRVLGDWASRATGEGAEPETVIATSAEGEKALKNLS
jgi:hypothetical protein